MTTTLQDPLGQWTFFLVATGLFTPLLSSLIACLVSSRYSWIISLTAPFMLLISAAAFVTTLVVHGWGAVSVISWPWFEAGDSTFMAGIYLDRLTLIMIVLVSVISFLIHLYSTGYMAGDEGYRKFFSMLGFFTFAMLGLVLADNLLLIFVFWELVGFSSYLLIGHWTELPAAGGAAKKAFLINRLGDLGFIAGLMILYQHSGSFQLTSLESFPSEGLTAASLCFFLGVMGKSAQFPLLIWLPDAMAGPTPVSALIHAATMVAAGIFLLARIHMLFTPESLTVVVVIGSITGILGAIAALLHYDMKKILAYSTLSQLGFMVMAFGTGDRDAAIFHLYTHAFFKAGLFLAAGSIIHVLHQAQQATRQHFDVQDIRNLGSLRQKLPLTFAVFAICGASLSGIPFFSGFQSKESLFAAFISWNTSSVFLKWLVIALAFLISFLTACYTVRLIWSIFFKVNSSTKNLEITEPPFVMRLPMIAFALGSGFWMVSWNPVGLAEWIPVPHPPLWLSLFSAGWIFLAAWVGYTFFRKESAFASERGWKSFFYHTAYLDLIWTRLVTAPARKMGTVVIRVDQMVLDTAIHMLAYAQVTLAHLIGWFDKAFIDGCVNGVARIAGTAGMLTRSFQGGRIQLYIFWSAIGILLIALFLLV